MLCTRGLKWVAGRQEGSRYGGSSLLGRIERAARIGLLMGACRKGKEGDWMKESKGGKEVGCREMQKLEDRRGIMTEWR
ncbi:MAG: hypothetical protein FD143_3696 [Ignavibacteria bacterium]|nr:MAG: hypothetical protein FD143_3696 [Ignavibacteria bacterium]